MAAPDKTLETRDGFKSRWGFILACIGSAVGMGNIWRFPIMVTKYGGLTFLIPYFIFVILIGCTGVIGEFALGRSAGAGPIGAFGKCTELRTGKKNIGEAIGVIPIIGSMALAIGYTVVMGWIFKYTFMAFSGGLSAMGQDMSVIGPTFDAISVDNFPWIVVAIVVSLIIMALGVSNGIEIANKIMMPVLFFLFVALGIYVFTLPGSGDGYKYLLTLNPKGLLNIEVWVFAFGQAFFSLSVAGNGSVIYGSYLPKNENLPTSARNVAIFDTLAALLAAFVIVPSIAASGMNMNDVSAGPGLMFVYLVNVINGMPAGRIIGIVFYVCVLFAGVSSIINLYEAPVATLQEKFGMKRLPATAVILVVGCVVAILIQAITSQWMDAVSIYICPLGAFLAGVMFFWVAGKEYVLKAVNEGKGTPIGNWFYPLAKYVYCILAVVALVAGAFFGGIG
ncbi:sodium-dependent transporter [Flavonifractor hominis]|uniref:Sodium-dependent transporter n=1 Tax=Flavonifractor hominis TaxID=3133178 RepID=A0ABV1EPK2_9FIRM